MKRWMGKEANYLWFLQSVRQSTHETLSNVHLVPGQAISLPIQIHLETESRI